MTAAVDYRQVRRVARRVASTLPPYVDTADLEQEAVIAAWQATARHRPDGAPLGSFVLRRAEGAVRDAVRDAGPYSRRGKPRLTITPLDDAPELAAPARDVADEVALRDAIRSAVSGLPERERLAITEHYLRDRALADVGRSFGCSESAVCHATRRALKRLAEDAGLRSLV